MKMTKKELAQFAEDIIDICEDEMDYYLGHSREDISEAVAELLERYN